MRTCKNCGLQIIWEDMVIETKKGPVCHPDCKPGSKRPVRLEPTEPVPIKSKKKGKKWYS